MSTHDPHAIAGDAIWAITAAEDPRSKTYLERTLMNVGYLVEESEHYLARAVFQAWVTACQEYDERDQGEVGDLVTQEAWRGHFSHTAGGGDQ
ncbi:hypothetical protein [Pseudactinotalea sp. Z1748]|uniref:hypothetical protein n=1 Tax=Pseudactinotalea sp. Z1748 TaxID=3413027 RepID=UPI003C7D021A